ncbi:hypothetical protein CH063_11188, partial [Colletotrichum higginsianum]
TSTNSATRFLTLGSFSPGVSRFLLSRKPFSDFAFELRIPPLIEIRLVLGRASAGRVSLPSCSSHSASVKNGTAACTPELSKKMKHSTMHQTTCEASALRCKIALIYYSV